MSLRWHTHTHTHEVSGMCMPGRTAATLQGCWPFTVLAKRCGSSLWSAIALYVMICHVVRRCSAQNLGCGILTLMCHDTVDRAKYKKTGIDLVNAQWHRHVISYSTFMYHALYALHMIQGPGKSKWSPSQTAATQVASRFDFAPSLREAPPWPQCNKHLVMQWNDC